MLHLIVGPDHKVNTMTIMNRLLDKVKQGKEGQCLIVPEHLSFEMERALCRLGGNSVCRYAEVLSLPRLASRVEAAWGGTASVWLDNGGRLLAAAQAVEQVYSRLKLFAPVCKKPHFLESFLALVDEIGNYGITTEDLTAYSKKFTGQFSQKLQELALLYESYQAVCATAKDPVARLQNLLDVLREDPFCEGKDFYVCHFLDFSALERKIVEELIFSADSVTVALPEERDGELELFPASAATARRLKQFCQQHGISVKTEQTTMDDSVPEDVYYLQKNLTRGDTGKFSGNADNVTFLQYLSPEQECRNLAAQIREKVAQGARYRQIAIACGDYALYAPILSRVLDLADIPHYAVQKVPVASLGGAKMVLYALRALAMDMDRECVIDYLKTGAADLSDDACDRLENYAILWDVGGSKWTKPWQWHPEGIGCGWKIQHEQELAELNIWRESAMTPLAALRKQLQNAASVAEMAEGVFAFMQDIRLDEKLQEYADSLYDSGEYQRAQMYTQVYDILTGVLRQICLMMPEATRSITDFAVLFEKLLEQYSVGTVPATVDEVQIGDITSFRGKEVDHLLIIGANDGVFPACGQKVGIFTEDERSQLISAGMTMAPLRLDAVDRELAAIYSTVRSARVSVSMSCAGEPSYLMRKAASLFHGITTVEQGDIILNASEYAASLLRRGENNGENVDKELLSALQKKRNYSFGDLQQEQVKGLYGTELSLSASRIDKVAACRFAYFLRYGLRAEERKEADLDASAFGTFVHAILEMTVEKVMELGGFKVVDEDELESIARKAMKAYAEEFLHDLTEKNPRFHYQISRNADEAMSVAKDLWEELRCSEFAPAANELKFAEDGLMPPVYVTGKNAVGKLTGFVDRVDLYNSEHGTFVRVVDYKTGHKDFDYTELSIGAGMQMLIYLFALKEHGAAVFGRALEPTGVLYHPARQDILPQDARLSPEQAKALHQKAVTRKGLVVDDEAMIDAMEHFEKTPRYLPFRVTKNGRSGDLATGEELRMLERHVFRMLGNLADDICSGNVSPNPVVRDAANSACTYCEYAGVCQRDLAKHEERYLKKVTNREFFAMLQKEAEING